MWYWINWGSQLMYSPQHYRQHGFAQADEDYANRFIGGNQ